MGNVTATDANIDTFITYLNRKPWWVNNFWIRLNLLETYIDKPWNFKKLTRLFANGNKESETFLKRHLDKPWD